MNPTLRDTLRSELVHSKNAGLLGCYIGLASFVLLFHVASSYPAVMAFLDDYKWASVVFLLVGVSPGIVAGFLRHNAVSAAINRLDDNTLKHQHNKINRRKRISDILFTILVALVVAYLIFRR